MKLQPSDTGEAQQSIMNGLSTQLQEEEATSMHSPSSPHQTSSKETKTASADTSVSFASTTNSTVPMFCKTSNSNNNVANKCICQSCIERKNIETEHFRRQLRHAWTQVRHIVYCAYFGPCAFNAVESEEFKSYVELLVSQDAHLLFCRIESTARDYVNGIKTRLLKQLTNGFNTPILACGFVDAMFDEYTRLINSAKTVSTFLYQLEEQYLSHFNNANWEMHNINLFQSMIFNLPAIHRTFAEIIQQLRMASAHCDAKHENKFTVALMRFHTFEAKMQELAVQWRDIQKQIDDFHDHRLEIKQRRQKPPPHHQDENPEKFDFYKIQQETAKQLRLLQSKQFLDKADEAKLSLTLRKCFGSDTPSSDKFVKTHSATADKNDDESDTDPPFESPIQSDGSFNEACYLSQSASNLDVTSMPLCADYLQNIHPPSVSSGDSDGSSDESPCLLERPHLSPQQCSNDLDSNSLRMDGQPNIMLNSATRSFILPTFHHAPSYHTHHLHQLQKHLLNPSEQAVNMSKFRPPSPTVKTKTDSASNPNQPNSLDNLFVDANDSPSFKVSEDSLTASPSIVFGSRASDILADLPQMIKSTANRVSNITSLVENLCKDAWSSPSSSSSSSSNNVASTEKGCLANRTRHKHVKLKKKKKPISRPKHKVFSENNATDHNAQHHAPEEREAKKSTPVQVVQDEDGANEVERDAILEESDIEIEEDADDEYEDEADDVCKCQKCRQLFKSHRTPSDPYFQFEDFKHQYLSQDDGMDGDGPCKCSHCMQLVTASFLAAHSSKAQSNLANFNPIDLPDDSMHSPFFSSMQNIHPPSSFMIHPHLYGLQAMGGTNAMVHPFEPGVSSATSQSRDATKSNSPLKNDSGSQENCANNGGGVFPHLNSNSSADWDMFGKSASTKFSLNSTGQNDEAPTSMAEWSASNHQAWLNTPGGVSGVLPPHLIPSAFQQYINNSSIAGQQGFFPLISGATHLSHPGIHSTAAYFQTPVENEGWYNSAADGVNISSSSLSSSPTSTTQHTSFSSSSYMSPVSSTSSASTSPSAGSSCTSIFTPTSSNYFSPSLYSQIPALSSNNISPFSLGPPLSSANTSPLVSTTSHGTPAAQAIHFHPGTSVSLKDAHFNMPLHDNSNLMFNPSLAHFPSGERPGHTTGPSQNLFSTPPTLSQASCVQHNPFLQPIPVSSAPHSMEAYANAQGQNSTVTQVNISAMTAAAPTSTAANTLHIRQQILRRKKLVAHSKLAKQLRPHQHNQKLNEQSSALSDSPQTFQKPHNQSPLSTPPSLSPNQSPQAGSAPTLEAPKQHPPPAAPGPSMNANMQQNSSQIKENHAPPDIVTTSVTTNQSPAPKQTNLPAAIVEKEDVHPNVIPAEHMHPPNYHHVSGNCHDPSVEGSVNDPSAAAHNQDHPASANSGNNAAANNNCKYCNCCYCEFFGNGGPAPTPTSKNYTEMRERLLRKLHTKTKKSNPNGKAEHVQPQHISAPSRPALKKQIAEASVDDLLSFIEGDKGGQDGGAKKSKKSKQKQKKDTDKSESSIPTTLPEKLLEKEKKFSTTSDSSDEKPMMLKPEKNVKDAIKENDNNKAKRLSLIDLLPDVEAGEDKTNSKKKKKKKQTKQEEDKSTDASYSTRAFLDEPTPPVVNSTKKTPLPSQAPVSASSEKNPEKMKSKSVEDNRKPDTPKSQQERKKPEAKKPHNKLVNGSVDKVGQNVATALANKNMAKKNKGGGKVDSAVPTVPDQKANNVANHDRNLSAHDRNLSAHIKEKSLNKRLQTEQIIDRNQSTAEATQKLRKKNGKAQKAPLGILEKNIMNGQDFASPHVATASQPRDRNSTDDKQASSKDCSAISFASRISANEQDRPTENGVDSKKNRLRKSRRKNAKKSQSSEKSEVVDQVFLPREVLEEDAKELDDTEKEIDNFKRFCLNSSALNKQKKITVNWKEFNFKKNH